MGRSAVITVTGITATTPVKGSTLKQIRDRIYHGLGEFDRDVVDEEQVEGIVNDAYLDLCGRLRLNQSVVEDVTTEAGTVTVPPDFQDLVELRIGALPLQESTSDAFNSWKVSGGRPGVVLYRLVGSEIQTYPTDDTVNTKYELRYVATPRKLEDDSDLFVALPLEFEPKLVSYSNAHLMWLVGNTQSGDRFMTSYLAGLPGDKDARKKWETAHPVKVV